MPCLCEVHDYTVLKGAVCKFERPLHFAKVNCWENIDKHPYHQISYLCLVSHLLTKKKWQLFQLVHKNVNRCLIPSAVEDKMC